MDANGPEHVSASIHAAIADVSLIDVNGAPQSMLEPDEDILSELSPPSDSNLLYDAYGSLDSVAYRTQIAGLHSGQIQQVTIMSDVGDQYQDAMTDYPGVAGSVGGVESSLLGVLVDNGGVALTSAQQAAIRSDYDANAVDPDNDLEAWFKTVKDSFKKKFPADLYQDLGSTATTLQNLLQDCTGSVMRPTEAC